MSCGASGKPTLQQLIRHYPHTSANPYVDGVMQQLGRCRTAALGYHLYQCTRPDCSTKKYQYHSCRNRHCPQCGTFQKEQWIEDRKRELFPIPYFHVVFTLPHELNSLILGNRRALFTLLFQTSAQTLQAFAADPKYLGAKPGFISVLHTWGQQLSFHPHVHCIVSGGGMRQQGDALVWKQAVRHNDRFLFPVRAMAMVYRAKFLQGLLKLVRDGKVQVPDGFALQPIVDTLYKRNWVVYAKRPFGGPEQVIEYLGRYTHKVAISNQRIQYIDHAKQEVVFAYKDYTDGGKQKQMTLRATEFLRRFEQHILPKGLTKIRSYGYLGNRGRAQRIRTMLLLMKLPLHPVKTSTPWEARVLEATGVPHNRCPACQKDTLQLVQVMVPDDS